MRDTPARSRAPRDPGVGIKEGGWPPVKITGTWSFPRLVDTMAQDRGGNALALPILFAFMLLAFGAGCAVGWWAWS